MQIRDIFQLLVALHFCIVIIPCFAKNCPLGFYLSSNKNCVDDNECGDDEDATAEARCGANTECYNTNGSFYCTCKKGFTNELGKYNFTTMMNCRENNECFQMPPVCGPNTICYNTVGSYYCLCAKGFITRSGLTNFTDENTGCIDVDECLVKDQCGSNATCTNTAGSFNCSCVNGYTTNTGERVFTNIIDTQCQDVDECLVKDQCGSNAACINTLGSFNCSCEKGFTTNTGEPVFTNITHTQCQDVDECTNIPGICRDNASCVNEPGAFRCFCDGGFAPTNGELYFTNATEDHCEDLQFLEPKSSSLEDIDRFAEVSLQSISKLGNGKSKDLISNFLSMMEKHVILAARSLHHEEKKRLSASQFEISIQAIRNSTIPKDGKAQLATAKNRMSVDWNTVAGKEDFDVAAAALISYKQLDSLMNTTLLEDEGSGTEYEFISEIVTAAVSNPVKENHGHRVNLTFENTKLRNRTAKCVYWENSAHTWSSTGCSIDMSNTNFTTCSCSHLSSFAVLMALHEITDPSHIYNLGLITNIGVILSLVCLFLSILTFILCRSIKSIRTTIHTHLCVSLFLAELLFLTGISRVHNKVGCAIIAGFLHYLFLACFAWMLLEGVQLYLMLVKVFKAKSLQSKYMLLFGYGFPLLVVGISAVAYPRGYGTPQYCWLDLKSGFVWAFLLPVCIIILVNACFFIVTVWRLVEKFTSLNPDMNELKKIRIFTFTAIAQLCLLGCTWIFGMLHFQEGTIAMAYIFTIVNSLQGVFIFILHCVLNKQVRDEYAKFFIIACHMKKTSKYSEFSTVSTQGLRSTHETGM